MRICCLLMTCLVLQGVYAQEALKTGNSQAQRSFDRMLLALSQGDVQELDRMSLEDFTQALGRLDKQDQAIIRQRQRDLRLLIKQLDKDNKDAALTALDHKCKSWLKQGRQHQQLSLFLPAPSAQQILRDQADYAFDHGDFRTFLQLSSLLGMDHDQRISIAEALLGNQLKLKKPGLVIVDEQNDWYPQSQEHGQRVLWSIHNGYVHACDPWHSVLWQRALGKYSEIQLGPQHVLIKDKLGFSIINDQGYSTQLPNIPKAQSICVNNHRAWFQLNNKVYGYHLQEHKLQSINLPGKTLCAPLDDGINSLWLCEHELVFFDGQQSTSILHRIPISNDKSQRTHFINNDGQLSILNGKQLYRILDYNNSIKAHPIATLCAEQKFTQAWTQCTDKTIDKNTHKLWWPLAPVSFLQLHKNELYGLDYNNVQKLFIAHRIQQQDPQRPFSETTILENVLKANPEYLLPMAANDYLKQRYVHALSVSGLKSSNGIRKQASKQQPDPTTFTSLTQANSNKEIQSLQHRYAATLQEDGSIIAQCHNSENTLLWSHQLDNKGYHPSLSLNIRADYIIITAGIKRCIILNSYNGSLICDVDIQGKFNEAKFMHYNNNTIFSIGPVGINNRIHKTRLIDGVKHSSHITLEHQIRWILPIGNKIIISDGSSAYSIGVNETANSIQLFDLPQSIIKAQRVDVCSQGIIADQNLYYWANND